MKFPEEFEKRMQNLLADEYDAFAAAYENPPIRGLHVNLHKISAEEFEKAADFPTEKLGFSSNAYGFNFEKIGSHPLHHAGAFYVQEPSAMLPAAMLEETNLADRKNIRVLDMCAAPGGKSSQAANLFAGHEGFLLANEYVPKRALTLAENIERLGIAAAAVTNLPSDELAAALGHLFDLTIVDAPCSGEGMFRKNPDAITNWSVENVKMCAERQRAILSAAAETVADGGYLLYSTCTFSVEENEENVLYFLEKYPDFEPVLPPEKIVAATACGISVGGRDMSFCRRAYPHIFGGEGQFAALFRRCGEASESRAAMPPKFERPDKAEEKIILDFLGSVLTCGEKSLSGAGIIKKKDGFYAVSRLAALPEKGVLSPGVKLGEIRKGRFIPHHRFFMAYGQLFKNRFELTKAEAADYIRGLAIPCRHFEGYGAAAYCGCTLGGVKVSEGIAKNHYPKGLRAN